MATTGSGAPWTVTPAAAGYLNFDLVIERSDGETYRARVVASPGGEAERIFTAPFSPDELETLADQVDPSRRKRKAATPHLSLAKDMGARLHNAVLRDEIRVSLARARDAAEREGAAGVRIRLHLDGAPQLAVLPWEFMFDADPKVGRFLALSDQTPLVRYVDLPEKVRPLSVTPPIRVLGVVSNPADDRYPELDVEKEWSSLQEALQQPIDDGRLELVRLPRATLSSLLDKLRESDCNVLHFIGHGTFDDEHENGLLAFEGERGGVNEVSAERLGTLLYDESALRLVVLNACEGGRASATDPYAGMAQTLVRMRVPAVVAMQFEITDRAAIAFARWFYKGIALGRPVDTAITDARKAIFSLEKNDVEWATPVLYMRAPDGRIFDLPRLPLAPPGEQLPAEREGEEEKEKKRSPWQQIVDRVPRISRRTALIGLAALLAIGAVATVRCPLGILGCEATAPLPPLRVTAIVPAGERPDGVAVDDRAGRIYVVNGDAQQLRIFDANTKAEVTTLRLAAQPVDVAADASLGLAYVTEFKADSVAIVDRNGTGVLARITVDAGPFAVAVHPDTHRVYVTSLTANTVSVIDGGTRRLVKKISVGKAPSGIAINSSTGRAYVADLGSNTVTVIDTESDLVVGIIPLAAAPGRVAVDPERDLVLTTNPDDDSVTIINGATRGVETKIAVGKHPLGIIVDPWRARAYVAVEGSNAVAVIDLARRMLDHSVTVGSNPARLAINPALGQLYVTNIGSGNLYVLE